MPESNKNNTCQRNSTRVKRKSPKILKNLVIPCREYYETPVLVSPPKISTDLFSKESSGSIQTQGKDYSEYLGKKDYSNIGDFELVNKSDIVRAKNLLLEKSGFETKKQISFVKQKIEGKFKNEQIMGNFRVFDQKNRVGLFKNSIQKEIFKKPIVKNSIFKKTKINELVNSSNKLFESKKLGQSFQKNYNTEKKITFLTTFEIYTLKKNEEYLGKFLKDFQLEIDLTDSFKEYINWAEKNDFKPIIDNIQNPEIRNLFKISLLFERISFYICYFIYSNDFNKDETIFLKKTVIHIYLNFLALIQELRFLIPEVN